MTLHYGAAILIPAMALVIWLLIRGLSALILFGIGGLMVFHSNPGPFALVSLAAASYLIDRRPLPALQPA